MLAYGVRSYVIVCAKRRRIALDKNYAHRIPEKTKEKGLAERRRVVLVQLIYNNYYTLSIYYYIYLCNTMKSTRKTDTVS